MHSSFLRLKIYQNPLEVAAAIFSMLGYFDDSPDPCRSLVPSRQKRSHARVDQPRRMDLLDMDGPVVLVAVIAKSNGKWAFIEESQQVACAVVKQQLGPYENGDVAEDSVVALAAIRAWRFVKMSFRSSDAHALACAAFAHRGRQRALRFLEHEVLHVTEVPPTLRTLVRNSIAAGADARDLLHRFDNHYSFRLGGIMREWLAAYPELLGKGLVAWPLWGPLAMGVARGDWKSDVTVIFQRQSLCSLRAPILPSGRCLSLFRKLDEIPDMPTRPPLPLGARLVVVDDQHIRSFGAVQKWSARSMLISLDFSVRLLTQKRMAEDAASGTRAFHHFSNTAQPEALHSGPLPRMPSQQSLCRGRITFDIATMLCRRDIRLLEGPSFRHLGFDASPQRGGVEVFATIERTILKKDLAVSTPYLPIRPMQATTRTLPLASLGQGRASLSDKVQAHVNQSWLEHGGCIDNFMANNLDVRTIISDMGVEAGICDYADISHEAFADPEKPILLRSFNGHLYPLALYIPGPQHAIDNAMKDALGTLEWWPEWSATAKVLCQWVNSSAHRTKLQVILRDRHNADPVDNFEELFKNMDNGCDKFASWRWKTLSHVTRDLSRLKTALQETLGRANGTADLGISADSHKLAKDLIDATNSRTFWDRCSVLKSCVEPLAEFSSWLRGCACHETQRMLGLRVVCAWGGCRAPELSKRLRQLRDDLGGLRRDAHDVGDVGSEILHVLASNLLASVLTKFAWVDEIPYTIFTVTLTGVMVRQWCPGKCVSCLRQHLILHR